MNDLDKETFKEMLKECLEENLDIEIERWIGPFNQIHERIEVSFDGKILFEKDLT